MEESAPGSDDPGVVDTVVVHADDVVTAHEARLRRNERTILRLTPPFSARMRARIHVSRPGEYDGQDPPYPVHFPPAAFLGPDCPDYPEPDETAEAVAEDGTPDPERHHEHHREVVDQWRREAVDALRETASVDHRGGTLSVAVAVLG